ncbi:chaperone DnaJ protein [Trypanosoma grayi]|uniref:chaperone DnaJ protein n=1 Tax=Trypanosoma grayi TaxID=71804 RepID=UPI0004F4B60A|nr:chaperone DnaJ protein [Trypanosoma grayi]KEG10146.1 chaperone DnaJ protein [Trypanosoma grayi]
MSTGVRSRDRVRQAWKVLGLRAHPSYDEIRVAYYKLAVATHPDRSTEPNAKERFQVIHGAYEVALEDHQQAKVATKRNPHDESSNFDWRAEVARVRAACSSTFGRPRTCDTSPQMQNWRMRSTRRRAGENGAAHKTLGPNRLGKRGAAEVKRAAEEEAAAAFEEERRLQTIEKRRRRQPTVLQRQLFRIISSEQKHRRSIMLLERRALRTILLCFSEGRIRQALMQLEELTRREFEKGRSHSS